MYVLLFSLALVILYHPCAVHSQSCEWDHECYNSEVTEASSSSDSRQLSWRCCNKQCYSYRADSRSRCPCSSSDKSQCRTSEVCNLDWNKCSVKCFTDSDCYRGADDKGWRCCGDKQCHRTKNNWWSSSGIYYKCPCSSSEECPTGKECRKGLCDTPVPPGGCEEDSDCRVSFKICNNRRGVPNPVGSCQIVVGALLSQVIFPVLIGSVMVCVVVVCLMRRRWSVIRDRFARCRSAVRAPRFNRRWSDIRDRLARYRPAVPARFNRPRVAREETASQTTELRSAGTSCHNDSTVTVEHASPIAPPLTASENHSTAEETRDPTITSDTEQQTGIAASSATTTISSDLPSYNELQTPSPPPSYEEVMRNSNAEHFVL